MAAVGNLSYAAAIQGLTASKSVSEVKATSKLPVDLAGAARFTAILDAMCCIRN